MAETNLKEEKTKNQKEIEISNQLKHANRSIKIPEWRENPFKYTESLRNKIDATGSTITCEIQGDRPLKNRIRVKYPKSLKIKLEKEQGHDMCKAHHVPPDKRNVEGFIFIPSCFPIKWKLKISFNGTKGMGPKNTPNVTIEVDQ